MPLTFSVGQLRNAPPAIQHSLASYCFYGRCAESYVTTCTFLLLFLFFCSKNFCEETCREAVGLAASLMFGTMVGSAAINPTAPTGMRGAFMMSDFPQLTSSSTSKRFPKHKKRSVTKAAVSTKWIAWGSIFIAASSKFPSEILGNKASRCCVGGAVNLAWRIKPLPWYCSGRPLSSSCWDGC